MTKLTIKQQMHLAVIQKKALMSGYLGISLLCNSVRNYVYYNECQSIVRKTNRLTRKESQSMIDSVQLAYDMLEEREISHG